MHQLIYNDILVTHLMCSQPYDGFAIIIQDVRFLVFQGLIHYRFFQIQFFDKILVKREHLKKALNSSQTKSAGFS